MIRTGIGTWQEAVCQGMPAFSPSQHAVCCFLGGTAVWHGEHMSIVALSHYRVHRDPGTLSTPQDVLVMEAKNEEGVGCFGKNHTWQRVSSKPCEAIGSCSAV